MEIWLTAIPLIGLMIIVIAVYTIWAINKEKKSGFPLEDERTAKIQGRVFKAGFYIGVFYLLALNFYNMYRIEFQGLRELSSMPVINSAVIIMGVSVIVFTMYIKVKEDL